MERNAPLFEASPSLDQPREFFLSLGGVGGSLRNQVDREGGAGQDRTRVNSLEDGTDLGGMDGVNLGDRVHRSTLGSTPMDGSLPLGFQANETGQPDTLKGKTGAPKGGTRYGSTPPIACHRDLTYSVDIFHHGLDGMGVGVGEERIAHRRFHGRAPSSAREVAGKRVEEER